MRRFLLLAAWTIIACSDSNKPASDASPDVTPMNDDASADAGPQYPAPHSPMPQLLKRSGPVIASPKFLPITFMGDPLQKDIDDFMQKMSAAKDYWSGAVSEYGVGPATTLAPVHSSDTPAMTLDDTDIQAWLKNQIQSTPMFPQPDDSTIFTVFYPMTNVTMGGGKACQDFNGYHSNFQIVPGKQVIYAVIPRCPPPVMKDTLTDMMAAIASHELAEAATDPLPQTAPAWSAIDNDHLGWSLVTGGVENGDLCAPFPGVFSRTMTNMPYLVQRTWSNAAAMAGHDPCAPNGVSPYFNSAPVLADTVFFTRYNQKFQTKGVLIPVGQSGTVELDLYSDGPTSGPWTVQAIDFEQAFMGKPAALKFSFDKTMGQNGDVIQLTITVMRKGTYGAEPFWIYNKLGMQTSVWIGVVGN